MKLVKTLRTLSAFMLICYSASALAQDPILNLTPNDTQALIQLLKSCDSAQSKSRATVADKDALIAKQQDLLTVQAKETSELKATSNGVLTSPILWFALGMVVTGLTVKMVR